MSGAAVLVTGWACPTTALEPLANALGGTTLLYDFHAHLHTGSAAAAASTNDCADGLIALLSQSLEPLPLIGWSTGALVALQAALRSPERVRCLILISGTARFTSAPDYGAGVPMKQLDELQAGLMADEARSRGLARFMMQSALPRRLDRKSLARRVDAANSMGAARLCAGLAYLRDTDVRGGIAGIQHPTLLLHGTQDAVVPITAAHWLAQHLPQARLEEHPQAGHDWPLHDPETAAQRIHLFLAAS